MRHGAKTRCRRSLITRSTASAWIGHFGGDWPVLELAASYGQWVDIVDRATQHLSHADRRKIFRENAIKTYRLDQPA